MARLVDAEDGRAAAAELARLVSSLERNADDWRDQAMRYREILEEAYQSFRQAEDRGAINVGLQHYRQVLAVLAGQYRREEERIPF